jgi:hypothetical protein
MFFRREVMASEALVSTSAGSTALKASKNLRPQRGAGLQWSSS